MQSHALRQRLPPPVNYTNNSFPIPAIWYIVAFMGCISVYTVAVSIQNTCWLEHLGKKSLLVLVIHKFPIVFLQIVGPFAQLLKEADSIKGFFLAGIPVSVISIGSSIIAGNIIEKFFPGLVGKKMS